MKLADLKKHGYLFDITAERWYVWADFEKTGVSGEVANGFVVYSKGMRKSKRLLLSRKAAREAACKHFIMWRIKHGMPHSSSNLANRMFGRFGHDSR